MSVIQLKNISRIYRSGSIAVEALKGISLTIEKGDFVAIMGSSGSGKSTLMNILGCLDRPTEGSYFLDGKDVAGFDKDQLASVRNKTLGFVFQNFHLLPRTSAIENVELPLLYSEAKHSWKEIRKRAAEALQIVGLAEREKHTPNELSGGQMQRVAIARALVTHPRVLLADEPTGNLDSRTSLEVIDIFQKLNREGLTIIMVTHEPDIARFAHRTIVLRDGLLKMEKKTDALQAANVLENWSGEDELFDEMRGLA